MKEVDVAKYFTEYLSNYDLYFEIPGLHVDIVAKSENILIACEVKRSLNFKVIEQAARNCHWFHYSYICVPKSKDMSFAMQICEQFGIGVLVVDITRSLKGYVCELKKPRLNRHAHKMIKYVELPEMSKRSIPGASGSDGTTITPFKETVENITRYLRRHNGAPLREVYDNVATHYSNFFAARSCLYQWINKGIIKDFYINKSCLYLSDTIKEEL
jgi:hypothetical protein